MAGRNTYFQDEVIEKKIDLQQLGRTIRYILPHKKQVILAAVLMFSVSVVALIPPILLKTIINHTVVVKDPQELIGIIVAMACFALLEIGITFGQARVMGRLGHTIIAEIREEIFDQLQKLPFEYFDNRPNGKIVVRVTEYINGLANFFTNYFMTFFAMLVKLIIVTIFMIYYSPILTLAVYASVGPMMALIFFIRYKVRQLFSVHRAKVSNRTAFLIESIMGERIVKYYDRMETNEDINLDVHMQSVHQWWRIVVRMELNSPVVIAFWNIGTLLIYGIAFAMILSGTGNMTAGVVILFTQYMMQFTQPLQTLAQIIQNLAEVSSNLERVFDTIDYPVDIKDDPECVELSHVKGKVDFDDVIFSYDGDENILEHFDLHVKPGETIALVGPTGAGKTTVINMLTRFYDVREGNVKIDDTDVRKASLHSLRKEVGVLMQDPFIFKGSIIDNIRYGRPDATDEECRAAAARIHADTFILKFKDGYEHQLEERGGGLSAGEKQLISFARIVLKNPSVIILDEATSSIDTETETLIQAALDDMIREKTAFIVAHRLSTIRNADRILYIANKGIAEQGSHAELMAQKGLYYALNA